MATTLNTIGPGPGGQMQAVYVTDKTGTADIIETVASLAPGALFEVMVDVQSSPAVYTVFARLGLPFDSADSTVVKGFIDALYDLAS